MRAISRSEGVRDTSRVKSITVQFGYLDFIIEQQDKVNNNEQLVSSILNLMKKHKINFNNNFSILVNNTLSVCCI